MSCKINPRFSETDPAILKVFTRVSNVSNDRHVEAATRIKSCAEKLILKATVYGALGKGLSRSSTHGQVNVPLV
jgi:hypothetical protein